MKRPLIDGGAAPRGLSTIGDHIPFLTALAAIPSMPRWQLARIANRAIECIDQLDADTDLEPNGDELDGTAAEDEAGSELYSGPFSGPGCVISDPDAAVDDSACDEPNQDLEPETWSHPDDHPSELFIGRRP